MIRRLGFRCNKNVQFWNAFLSRPISASNVESLSLFSVRWHSMVLKTQLAILHNFAAIVRLELGDFAIATFSQLPTIICSFPHLETLVIEDIRWLTVDIVSPTLRLPANFRALEFKGSGTECILRWLSSFQAIPSLTTVYLHDAYPWPSETDAFFKVLGPSLETLFCDLRKHDGKLLIVVRSRQYSHTLPGQDWPPNLSHNRNLRTLHLRLSIAHNIAEGTQCITRTLTQIVSDHIDKVIVEYNQVPHGQPEHEYWSQVDAALAQPQFGGLSQVEIRNAPGSLLSSSAQLALQAWFISKLPACHTRGILRVLRTVYRITYL